MYRNLLKTKKDLYQEKLRENVGKPNELWKALKSLGLPSKINPVSQVSLKDGEKFRLMKRQIITPLEVFTLI